MLYEERSYAQEQTHEKLSNANWLAKPPEGYCRTP